VKERPVEIFDGHCHVASTRYIPEAFIDGTVDNALLALSAQGVKIPKATVRDRFLAKLQDASCDELVAEMDAAGVTRAVLLLADLTWALPGGALTIAEMMAEHHKLLARHPGRFVIFAGVDPRWGRDGVALFERATNEYGFRGLKLYPPCGYSPSDRAFEPYFEICRDKKLPVVVHTGGTSPALSFDTARPILIDEAARRFPTVNFILAHGTSAYVEECRMECAFRPNVYCDASGFQSLALSQLRAALSSGIAHKVIFGTDWPVFRMQENQASCIDGLLGDEGPLAGMRMRELAAFFGGTMKRLLGEP
jgi:uncharacterized protein